MKDHKLLFYLGEFISPERKARFLEILEQRTKYITVAIEDVYQMHNTSAVIRSCEIFGVQEAHVIQDRNTKKLDKNIAMGAEKWVDTFSYNSSKSCINSLKEKGYKIVAATPHTSDSLLNDYIITDKTALFFGTEKEGLSDEVMRQADEFLKIPMSGFTESLNISVSVAIILHNLTEQLKKSNINWQLTDEEKLAKQIDWAKKSIKSIDYILERYSGLLGDKTSRH